MAMQPVSLIGSAIAPTSISSPFGAYGPQAGSYSAPSAAGGGGSAAGGSIGGGIGYLGAGALAAFTGLGSRGSDPANAASVYAIQQGAGKGALGNISAGLGAASMGYGALNKLTGGATASPYASGALGTLGGGLQFLQGIQRGGVQGYGSAVVGGLRAGAGAESLMGNSAMAGTLGSAAGYVAAPLALYSAIKNWQQGDVKGDTIRGAEAGAAIGSVVPGVGTVIGAVIGGVVGAASSALGNPGDREGKMINAISTAYNQNPGQAAQITAMIHPSSAVQGLQSLMSAETNTAGHSSGLEQAFGRNNVSGFVTQMATQVNDALRAGKIKASSDPAQVYSSIVAPWLKTKGASIGGNTAQGQNTAASTQGMITSLIGNYLNGSFNAKSAVGSGGQSIPVPALGSASSTSSTTSAGGGRGSARALARAA
jgi:hypothetical protein